MTPPAKRDAKPRPIIIKRKKIVAGGHHGGAWKVAYADFVTAMMAFFLVMWLLAAVNPDQRAAIFEYFRNPSLESGTAPKAAPGQNGPGGASASPIDLRGGLDARRSAEPVDAAERRQHRADQTCRTRRAYGRSPGACSAAMTSAMKRARSASIAAFSAPCGW